MLSAISLVVIPDSNSFMAPSGKVIFNMLFPPSIDD
jgi:hypothetical protein